MSYHNKYNSTFLNTVIFRIDFEDYLSDETIKKIIMSPELLAIFPIKGKDQIKEDYNYSVFDKGENPPEISKTLDQYIEKILIDNSGKNRIIASKKAIVFEYNQYFSFEETKKQISFVVKEILSVNSSIRTKRFGLRYINVFDSDTHKINKNYFADSLKGLVKFNDFSGLVVSRALGNIEFINDDLRLTMKYGNFNRNYPGAVEKYDFVLDYDAYVDGLCLLSDVFQQKLDAAHDMIQTAFESSITDNLRETMRG